MIGRSGERWSGISMLAARHDDDIYIYIKVNDRAKGLKKKEKESEKELKKVLGRRRESITKLESRGT